MKHAKYPMGTVIGIAVYKNDTVVIRRGRAHKSKPPERGIVTLFSKKSRLRLAFVASNTSVRFRTMITLTYPREFPNDGRQVKANLHAFMAWLKRDVGTMSYLWFLEFQRRGAPHIHILMDKTIPRNRQERQGIRFRVSAAWYRIVQSGDVRHLQAGTRTEQIRKHDGAARYCVKYAFKMLQKQVPKLYQNVGRFWGCSRNVRPEAKSWHVCTADDIRGVLEGWDYLPPDDHELYRTLYGTAERFRYWTSRTLDTKPKV